jgi:arylsulfatase
VGGVKLVSRRTALGAALGVAMALGGCQTTATAPSAAEGLAKGSRPNILLIVADDLGYQDLGLFGSEIRTPNIDRLAAEGVILSRFYTSVACQPTRAMLHSGTDNHLAGVGAQGGYTPDALGHEGYLTHRVASVAERMSALDYHSYMVGKWHLGERDGQTPADRGFERSFVLLQAGAFHFGKIPYTLNAGPDYELDGVPLASLPDDFYSTVAYTDHLIDFIDAPRDDDEPFFAFVSYTAPHWPIQALDEDMAKTRGRYDEGYDVIRERRYERWRELGFAPPGAKQPRLYPNFTPWAELSAQQHAEYARTMEAYAAMVERLDAEIGRLLDYLRASGELDNTLVIFMADNGAEAVDQEGPFLADYRATFDNSLENIGRANSYRVIGQGWGEAGSAPFFLSKLSMAEGGVHVPAIVSAPRLGVPRGRSDALIAVFDLAPTFVELAGGDNGPFTLGGAERLPMTGRSFAGVLRGEPGAARGADDIVAFEHAGHRAVYQGDWKALWLPPPLGDGEWALYDLANDPGENFDLAARHPELVATLSAAWDDYAASSLVRVVERPAP